MPEDYKRNVDRATEFLSTSQPDPVEKMRRKMTDLAENLLFENAQRVKQQIDAIEATLAPQCVERDLDYNQDVVYFGLSKALIAHIYQGMILTLELFPLPQKQSNPYMEFLFEHYSQSYPDEVMVIAPSRDSCLKSSLSKIENLPRKIKINLENIPKGLADLCDMNYRYRVPEDAAL